jgi:hypothetical protein
MDLFWFTPNAAAHGCHLVKAVILVNKDLASRRIRKDLLGLALLDDQV